MFYPDIKPHISPSALDSWHNSRSQFIKSYFDGVKMRETASMKAGKEIHALIEGGMIPVINRFAHIEKPITVELPSGVKVFGIPDSYDDFSGFFVDYKSGKENGWTDARLATDLKMKTTAWLVWQVSGKPAQVSGCIEYLATIWNTETREVQPTGEDNIVAASYTYTGEELEAFTAVIEKTIADVNAAYEEWLTSTDEYISADDIALYAELDEEISKLEERREEVKVRIADQLEFGKKQSVSTVFGTFSFRETKRWKYPKEIDDLDAIAKAARKKFETENDPATVSKSLMFRAKSSK